MKRGIASVKTAERSRSLDEGASGGGDLPMRYPMNAKYAVATGKKVVKGRRVKKEAKDAAATGSRRKVGTGRKVGKVHPVKNLCDLSPAAASLEAKKPGAASLMAAAEAEAAGNFNVKEGKLRLFQDYVDLISSWEPEALEDPDEHYARLINNPACYSRDDAERSRKIQQDLVAMAKFCAARMKKLHAWVRKEVQEKGYAEVDDYVPEGDEEDYALAFGDMDDDDDEEDEDEVFAKAFGAMEGVIAEDED